MEIGAINGLANEGRCFDHVVQFGFHVCQLSCWDTRLATPEIAQTVVEESRRRVCACVRYGQAGAVPPNGTSRWDR